MILVLQIIFAGICLLGIPAGCISALIYNHNLKAELRPQGKQLRKTQNRRDTHAQARQDGAFVDGFITSEALDVFDDMFKE